MLPTVDFPNSFCLLSDEKHWSNEKETVRLIEEVLVPYIKKFHKEKRLPNDQKKSPYMGHFYSSVYGQCIWCSTVSKDITESVRVPKNMTPHLLQPLDLTTNTSLKKIEKKTFSKYFSSSIIEALREDPTRGDTTIKVNLRTSVFRPLHANVTKETYQFFESLKG